MREKLIRQRSATKAQRKSRIRGIISGTAEKPRLSVFRSNKFLYAQAIDDVAQTTLAAADGAALKIASNITGAKALGAVMAEGLKAKGLVKIVFDRNGYRYHGVVAAFADSLREHGIQF